jgi:hypothetical protein
VPRGSQQLSLTTTVHEQAISKRAVIILKFADLGVL